MTNFNPSRRSLLGALLAGVFGWVASAKATPPTSPLAGHPDAIVPGVSEHAVQHTVTVLVCDSTGSSAQSFNWTIKQPQ